MTLESKIIIIDVDGCLTDNKVYFDSKGERIKGFHSRDIRAIRELIANGFEVIALTQSSWEGMAHWAKRTGASVQTHRDKWAWVSKNVVGPYIAVGDDTPDMETLLFAELAFCPKDADEAIQRLSKVRCLPVAGGMGVVAELVKIILNQSKIEAPVFPADRIEKYL